MTEISIDLLESARSARACMADVRTLAERISDLPARRIEPWLQHLVDNGEDRALSRFLQACALNEVRLDPALLCRCIGVCAEMPDSAPCFRQQDGRAVPPLLDTATDEELSIERQAYAGRLAAELCAKFGLDPQPVRKLLRKLERNIGAPESVLLIAESLRLLEPEPGTDPFLMPYWSEFEVSDLLPEQCPRSVVGGDYTVRRPVPKLGRNQPCHCGSGKKYKKCCYAKDQELMRDASGYAGTTRSELKARPALVDDPAVIHDMRAYELKRLKPPDLGARQLISGYQQALDFGLRELAFEMLLECEGRTDKQEFDRGHFEDLIERVLEAGDLDLARKIREHCKEHEWYRPHAIEFRFDLLEHPDRFEPLEQDCRNAACGVRGDELVDDDPVIRLAYDFASRFPALAMVFARAAIAGNPDRHFDNQMLLEVIRDARVDLDLEPWGDPAEALFDWIEDRDRLKAKESSENQQIADMSGRLEATRAVLDQKRQALIEMEQRVRKLGRELEKAHETVPQDPEARSTNTADAVPEKTLRRLRGQVENLKAEIGEQQEQRGRLRKLLANERKKHSAQLPAGPKHQEEPAEESKSVEPSGKLMPPEYSDSFRKCCHNLPAAVTAKAILAAARFAAHDPELWRQTRPLERLPAHYRIRIGRDYRLLVHWQPGRMLQVLDLIPRQDLEAWIKRHGR